MEIYLKDQLLNGELKDILFSSDTGNTNRNDKQYYSIKSNFLLKRYLNYIQIGNEYYIKKYIHSVLAI